MSSILKYRLAPFPLKRWGVLRGSQTISRCKVFSTWAKKNPELSEHLRSFVPVRFANSWQSASWVKFEQLKFEQSLFNVGDGSLAVPGRHWYPSSFHHFRNLSKSFNIFAFLMPSFLCAAARCPTAEVPCVCWVMWHSIRFCAILCNYMFWKRSDLKSLKESSLKEGPCEAKTSTNHSKKNNEGIETVWRSISLLVWGQEIVSMPQDTSCLLQGAQLVLWKLCGFKAKWKSMSKVICVVLCSRWFAPFLIPEQFAHGDLHVWWHFGQFSAEQGGRKRIWTCGRFCLCILFRQGVPVFQTRTVL